MLTVFDMDVRPNLGRFLSAGHSQLCIGLIDNSKQDIFLNPLAELFLLAIQRFL